MVIALIGPNGSGKDTQAELISKELGIHHFSIGAVMREQSKRGNPTAVKAQEYADKGLLAPDELVVELMMDYIERNCKDGFIVTGFPRMIGQFKMLDQPLEEIGLRWDMIIHLELSDEESMNRMKTQAKQAEEQGNPRPDATEEKMQVRLDQYHSQIDPVVEEAESRGILFRVDASPTIEEINKELLEIINKNQEKLDRED